MHHYDQRKHYIGYIYIDSQSVFLKKKKNRANSVDVNIALKQNKKQNNKNYIDEKQCSTIPVL